MFVSSASAPRAQDGIDTKSNSAPQQQIGRYDWLRQMGKDRALKAFHRVVLLHLALCRNDKTGRCDPGNKWLAEQAGCCERWVVEAIKLAEERGWLRRERARGGRSNNYVLTMSDVHSSSHQTDEAEPECSEPQFQADVNSSSICSELANQQVVEVAAEAVPNSLNELPKRTPKDRKGRKTPPSPSRTKEPAVDQPPQSEHDGGIHRLVAKSLAVAKPEIEWPLAQSGPTGNVVPIQPKRDFDRFWAIFPRDNNNDVKRAAINFHKACKLPGVNAEIIIAGAERYAAECAANPQKWKKLAPNWLFDECWNNVPELSRSNSHRSSSVIDDFGGLEGWMRAALNVEKPQ